jgi:hypothetical protein
MLIPFVLLSIGCGRARSDKTKNKSGELPAANATEALPAEPVQNQEADDAVAELDVRADDVAAAKAAARMLMEDFYRTPQDELLKQVLALNKPAADLDRLNLIAEIEGPIAEMRKFSRKDGAFYVVIATRMHHHYLKNAAGVGPPPQIAIVFSEEGRIEALIGGEVAADGVTGDTIELSDLGSVNSWFLIVRRFKRHRNYPEECDVYLVKDPFPRALRVHDFQIAYTSKFEGAAVQDQAFIAFIRHTDEVPDEPGIGRDGKQHPLPIYWDVAKSVFRGPSQITLDGLDFFDVDLSESHAFVPIDVPREPDQ